MVKFDASGVFYSQSSIHYRQKEALPSATGEKLATASIGQSGSREVVTYQTVHFRDPSDETKLISLRLSSDNLERLQDKFGAEGFEKQEDGTLLLTGKLEKFVAGWYREIAITRGYQAAGIQERGLFTGPSAGYSQTQSAVRMRFDYRFDGGLSEIGARIESRYETLGNQKRLLAQLDSYKVEELAKILEPKDFDAVAVPLALAKLSRDHHAMLIDLTETPLKTGSIEDALNTALASDRDLNGEIDLDEAVKLRHGENMTAQKLITDLTERYLAQARRVMEQEHLLPAHLREAFAQSGYVPNPNEKGSQTLRIMSLAEIEPLLEQIAALVDQARQSGGEAQPEAASQLRVRGIDIRA